MNSRFLTGAGLALSLTLTGCLTDDPPPGGSSASLLSVRTLSAGAQANSSMGSSIDLDEFRSYRAAEAKTISSQIDLIFGYSTATGAGTAIYSPHAAKSGIDGSSGFDFMQSGWATANNTTIKSVTVANVDNITTKGQLDSLWNTGSTVTNGRLFITSGTTFMAESNRNLRVLVWVTSVTQATNGVAHLHGTARF